MKERKMRLYYSINCGKDCEYYTDEHQKEKWADAMLYGENCKGYKVSNFGGITKDGENVPRYLKYDSKNVAEICVKIEGYEDDIKLYTIVASTFLPEPNGGYYEVINNKKIAKAVHHRDNNSYNFNPDNMSFVVNHPNGQPHLYYRKNLDNWDKLIEKICKKEK